VNLKKGLKKKTFNLCFSCAFPVPFAFAKAKEKQRQKLK
jgi:hypothetical protein